MNNNININKDKNKKTYLIQMRKNTQSTARHSHNEDKAKDWPYGKMKQNRKFQGNTNMSQTINTLL